MPLRYTLCSVGDALSKRIVAYIDGTGLLLPWRGVGIGVDHQLGNGWSVSAVIDHDCKGERPLGAGDVHRLDVGSGRRAGEE